MRILIKFSVGWLLLVIGSVNAASDNAEPTAMEQDLQPAFELFLKAAGGDTSAVDNALEQYQLLATRYPGSLLISARIASLTTMQARDAWMPWTKMRFAEVGTDQFDRVLDKLAPEHDVQLFRGIPVSLQIKLTAASTFTKMPKFLNRHSHGHRLFNAIISAPQFVNTPHGFQASVWLANARLAKIEDRDDDYRVALQKAVALDPVSVIGKQAAALLVE